MSKTFTERLRRCQEAADLTGSDMARWFDRPRATVVTWLNGRTPFGPAASLAERGLVLLEFSLRARKDYYPVPKHLPWLKREKYVRGMRDDAERNYRVPNMRAAG